MGHTQIVWASIGGKDLTLYYDYDRQNLSCLDADGKVEWFRRRVEFVFLEPLKTLYGGKTPAHRALNSTKSGDLPARSFVIPTFSVLLNGIEALGSFLTTSTTNHVRFYAFVETYMKAWDRSLPNSPYPRLHNVKEILWEHFRNGITHGFRIEGGGLGNEANSATDGWQVVDGRFQIGPHRFFNDFLAGVEAFFIDIKAARRADFLRRFDYLYPS